jgi:hypothetical protein
MLAVPHWDGLWLVMQVLLPNFTEQKAILRMILTEAGVINI